MDMNPGSLVVRLGYCPKALGIILRESNKYNMYPSSRWWEVVCNNKIIVESETYLEPIEQYETRKFSYV